MIAGYTFGCERDIDLCELMLRTRNKYLISPHYFFVENKDAELFAERFKNYQNAAIIIRPDGFGNGGGWNGAMIKLGGIKLMAEMEPDADYLMYCDSDIMFLNGKIFEALDNVGMQGLKHEPLYDTKHGLWSHFSGGCHFINRRYAKKLRGLHDSELNTIKAEMNDYNLSFNEDLVTSYIITNYFGGSAKSLPNNLIYCGDIEGEVQKQESENCIVHLTWGNSTFLGEPISGKWDIPRVLKQKGLHE